MVGPAREAFGRAGGGFTPSQAIEVYERLSANKAGLDEDQARQLREAVAFLTPMQAFVVLSKDIKFSGIHSRLFDAVHSPENPGDLMDRLGDLGTNKVAMAMAIEDENGNWYPTAVLYTYWSDREGLPDRIKPILDAPVQALSSEAKVVVPYTISSNFPKAGEALINQAHHYVYSLSPDMVLSTLSPLRAGRRGFAGWLKEHEGDADVPKDEGQLLRRVFDYLMPVRAPGESFYRSSDPVQSFHMAGMGAMLAAIQPGNADSPMDQSLAHGVMANYVYPADLNIMEENRRRFVEEGVVTISSGLSDMVPEVYRDRVYVQPFGPFLSAIAAAEPLEPAV